MEDCWDCRSRGEGASNRPVEEGMPKQMTPPQQRKIPWLSLEICRLRTVGKREESLPDLFQET